MIGWHSVHRFGKSLGGVGILHWPLATTCHCHSTSSIMFVRAIIAGLLAYNALAANWAVIISGSNTYSNYRHQADICHAYHLLTGKGGFPASNVITMMSDDIAQHPSNPFKGNLINRPGGENVYPGVVIDYSGSDVNAANFLAVLNGTAAGKSLQTGPDDNVFVYYADHGGVGLLGMPSGPYLYADELVNTLTGMAANKRFNKLVFYLEACESGSMFQDLPTGLNIFATTAATASESSYAYYYDSARGTYLGDEYSIRWMEDSDAEDESVETLDQQFNKVKSLVKNSHPQMFGDTSFVNEPIGDFQSFGRAASAGLRQLLRDDIVLDSTFTHRVSSRDVKLMTLTNMLHHVDSPDEVHRDLSEELSQRLVVDSKFEKLVSTLEPSVEMQKGIFEDESHVRDYDCLRSYVNNFENKCGAFDDYSLKHVRVLANLCGMPQYSRAQVHTAISNVCA